MELSIPYSMIKNKNKFVSELLGKICGVITDSGSANKVFISGDKYEIVRALRIYEKYLIN